MAVDHTVDRLELARLPSGVAVTTTVHTYAGTDAATGPTLYVQAAQHGREINGPETCRRLHDRLLGADLRGTVVVVPVADPLTFDRVSYTTPEPLDSVNANMNRVWPGDADGSLHERMAARLWDLLTDVDADAAIDLHTGGPDCHPHVVFEEGATAVRDLARAFAVDIDLLLGEPAGDDADAEWAARDFDGKFRVAAARAGIPTITPELAHNKTVVEPAVEAGVAGVLNVCRRLDLLEAAPTVTEPRVARNHLGRVRAAASGLFVPETDRSLGERVPADERLGTVYDPTSYAVEQAVETDRAGVLYALTTEATVTAGESLLSVALPRE